MAVIESKLDPHSPDMKANGDAWAALRADLQQRRATVAMGGPQKARERHAARGKLLPRERVATLLDPGSPFLEIGAMAANGMLWR